METECRTEEALVTDSAPGNSVSVSPSTTAFNNTSIEANEPRKSLRGGSSPVDSKFTPSDEIYQSRDSPLHSKTDGRSASTSTSLSTPVEIQTRFRSDYCDELSDTDEGRSFASEEAKLSTTINIRHLLDKLLAAYVSGDEGMTVREVAKTGVELGRQVQDVIRLADVLETEKEFLRSQVFEARKIVNDMKGRQEDREVSWREKLRIKDDEIARLELELDTLNRANERRNAEVQPKCDWQDSITASALIPPVEETSPSVEDDKKTIEEQKKLIDKHLDLLQENQRELAAASEALDELALENKGLQAKVSAMTKQMREKESALHRSEEECGRAMVERDETLRRISVLRVQIESLKVQPLRRSTTFSLKSLTSSPFDQLSSQSSRGQRRVCASVTRVEWIPVSRHKSARQITCVEIPSAATAGAGSKSQTALQCILSLEEELQLPSFVSTDRPTMIPRPDRGQRHNRRAGRSLSVSRDGLSIETEWLCERRPWDDGSVRELWTEVERTHILSERVAGESSFDPAVTSKSKILSRTNSKARFPESRTTTTGSLASIQLPSYGGSSFIVAARSGDDHQHNAGHVTMRGSSTPTCLGTAMCGLLNRPSNEVFF